LRDAGRWAPCGGGNARAALWPGTARDVERAPPLLRIERLGDAELKALAARSHPRARDAATPPRRTEAVGDEQATQQPPR
jgi:hypothetical protein